MNLGVGLFIVALSLISTPSTAKDKLPKQLFFAGTTPYENIVVCDGSGGYFADRIAAFAGEYDMPRGYSVHPDAQFSEEPATYIYVGPPEGRNIVADCIGQSEALQKAIADADVELSTEPKTNYPPEIEKLIVGRSTREMLTSIVNEPSGVAAVAIYCMATVSECAWDAVKSSFYVCNNVLEYMRMSASDKREYDRECERLESAM